MKLIRLIVYCALTCIASTPAFALTELRPLSCAREATLKSITGTTHASIEFENDSALTIKIFWLDYQGKRELYKTLTAGQTYSQPTFLTHPWIIADNNSVCRGIYEPIKQPALALFQSSFQDVSVSSGISNNTVATSGVQWIDYNNDKKLDLVLIGRNGNALFKNLGNGKFANVTQQANFNNGGRDANGASWADVDNDGFPDVFLANSTGAPTILANKKGVFHDITIGVGPGAAPNIQNDVGTQAGIWVDIDNDRLVDLFVIKQGVPNQLFKQTGLFRFTDIAASAGVAFLGQGRSVVSADFDGDGYQDLYLANFNQPNKLYHNNKNETFTDVGVSSGTAFRGADVKVLAVDYDNDQKMDLFIVNNAGPSFFYHNLGGLKFAKFQPSGLTGATRGIAAAFVDYNLDGNQDLVLAQSQGGNRLYKNLGQGNFEEVKGVDLSRPDNPSGVTVGDFNNDGIPDIAIGDAGTGQGDSLYKSDPAPGNHYLTVILQGTKSNRSAIGAAVLLRAGVLAQLQQVTGGNGSSQLSFPLQFGLGAATVVDSLLVVWPSHATTTLQNVAVNKTLVINEPAQ